MNFDKHMESPPPQEDRDEAHRPPKFPWAPLDVTSRFARAPTSSDPSSPLPSGLSENTLQMTGEPASALGFFRSG